MSFAVSNTGNEKVGLHIVNRRDTANQKVCVCVGGRGCPKTDSFKDRGARGGRS